MKSHRVAGGSRIHYLFKGHKIPTDSEAPESLVPYDQCPTPPAIYESIKSMNSGGKPDKVGGHKGRDLFVNAQWALGAEGSGAPMHFHNTAW